MPQLVASTLTCYQELERVQAPASMGSVAAVTNAITQAAKGDLGPLDALTAPSDTAPPPPIQSGVIDHERFAGAMRTATAAHDVPALRRLYAVCQWRNAPNMVLLRSATDSQIMTAAHHVAECYHPWPERVPERGQCITSPAE